MKILADRTLPHLFELFSCSFELTTYANEHELEALLPFFDVLLCRSTLKLDANRLKQTALQCIATASSGVDHIDTAYLAASGIHLFDAKGCNAEAVADYTLSTVAWLTQQRRIKGNQAGVIGLGEVGTRVVKRLKSIGLDVIQYDPIKMPEQSCTLEDLTHCNLLCIHANLHNSPLFPSQNLIHADFLAQLKPGTTLINAARGGIVNEADLLKSKQALQYCTDVYLHEPDINPDIITFSTLCTPHIAGHTLEAKSRAVETIAHALHAHFNRPLPKALSLPLAESVFLPKHEPWYERTLRLYNPDVETHALKLATNKPATFLTLRKAHLRHDFTRYNEYTL